MKILLLTILVLTLSFSTLSQTKPQRSKNISISITDDGPTAELSPIPIGFGKGLSNAKFGAKYFGPQSESDISIILLLAGTGKTYQSQGSFGIKFIVDEINLNRGKLRIVNSISDDDSFRVLQFSLTTEELAWIATADKFQIQTYDLENEKMIHFVTFTPSMMGELKDFAKAVLIIRNYEPTTTK